jgi:thiol:disulfide interchange protein DsbD
MNTQNMQRITVLVLLTIGLAVLLSVPAQGQDTDEGAKEQTWYDKLNTKEGIEEQFQSNSLLFFGGIFALGVFTSLTPCVLPMIPITISIVSGSKQRIGGQSTARSTLVGLANSVIYVLGISITYALLGVAAALLGGIFRSHLQNWPVQTVTGILLVILGLSMIGVISLPIPGWGRAEFDVVAKRHKAKRSLLAVFALGLISGVIASPCVAPVTGALLIWISQAGRIWLGFWALFTFGWGMGMLLMVMGLSGWVLSSGKWMIKVKAILGVTLMLMGILIIVQAIRGEPLIPTSLLVL